ncbi:hypothetical protein JRY29_07650 [Salmonella enterica subsp. enterica serovar Kentucky]|nr:hypothetical protein JRY29_07650 [Salmonella enterica subsp. enterica serovar Kentucky]
MLVKRVYPAGAGNTKTKSQITKNITVYPAGAGTLAIMYDELPKYRFIPLAREHTKH